MNYMTTDRMEKMLKRQKRYFKAYNLPSLNIYSQYANSYSGIDFSYINKFIEPINECIPRMSAIESYNDILSAYEPIQQTLRQLDAINFPYLHSVEMQQIASSVHYVNTSLRSVLDQMSAIHANMTASTVATFASSIDDVIVNTIGHLENIAEIFPDETEQGISKDFLDQISQNTMEVPTNNDACTEPKSIREILDSLTPSERIVLLFRCACVFISFLCDIIPGFEVNFLANYSNHTERVIQGDTIYETSDTNISFGVLSEETDNTQMEELSQQIKILIDKVDELEDCKNSTNASEYDAELNEKS